MEVSGDNDVLTFHINRGRMGVYHVLACRTTAGIHCSAGDCLQRAALTTSFMRKVAKPEPVLSFEKAMGRVRVDVRPEERR